MYHFTELDCVNNEQPITDKHNSFEYSDSLSLRRVTVYFPATQNDVKTLKKLESFVATCDVVTEKS